MQKKDALQKNEQSERLNLTRYEHVYNQLLIDCRLQLEQENDLVVNEIIDVDLFLEYSNTAEDDVAYVILIDNATQKDMKNRHTYVRISFEIEYKSITNQISTT